MPNHITTHLSIIATPTLIKELTEKVKLNENLFDFNGIIPMPEELKQTISPVKIVATTTEADEINNKHVPDEWNSKKYQAISTEEHQRRVRLYRADNWYDWSRRRWGTKWNAYDVYRIATSETNIVVSFDTAWSIPEGIFDKLEELGYELHYYWYDEGDNDIHEYGEPSDYFDAYIERKIDYIGAN